MRNWVICRGMDYYLTVWMDMAYCYFATVLLWFQKIKEKKFFKK